MYKAPPPSPAPWKAKANRRLGIIDANGVRIAVVHVHRPTLPRQKEDYDVEAANARLMAASPRLMKALKALVAADNCNYMAETMRYQGLFEEARQAIAEADPDGTFQYAPAVRKPNAPQLNGPDAESTPDLCNRNGVRVTWENIGEGYSGDFNPADGSNDVNLLRFSVQKWNGTEWEDVEDGSYCTHFPADTIDALKQRALQFLLNQFIEPVTQGQSVKKLGERLSWIRPEWITMPSMRRKEYGR